MNELVKLAINAHGGLDNWNRYSSLSAHLIQGGALWSLKGKAGLLDDVNVTVDLKHQWASHAPFGAPDVRSSFQRERVALEKSDGTVIEQLEDPRA
ncbi:hypothetical protein, partial [Silvibacterium sp.]|uniref:hypothetical protein n=1 Tax=Silvibacterium sp. TaxID=1964179 RepID=UPI0039E64873